MGSDTPDDPPSHVLNALGVRREKWLSMSDAERAEVASDYVENVAEAFQPVIEWMENEFFPAMNEAVQVIGDSLLEIDNQIPDGAVNHPDMTVAERQHLVQFRTAASELRRVRNR